jgi:hypothetical protein
VVDGSRRTGELRGAVLFAVVDGRAPMDLPSKRLHFLDEL